MQVNLRKTAGSCLLFAVVLLSTGALADPESDYSNGVKAYDADDLITAMGLFERAAQAGHAKAQYLLGYILDKAEDNAQAMSYYRQSADNGNGEAAYAVGTMYANADGVDRDYAQARDWFEKAAALGFLPALETLGLAYIGGELGLEKDRAKGMALLQQAADSGNESAAAHLQREQNL